MRVLINGSNIHSGGGLQVVISFLYEVSLMDLDSVIDFELDIVISSQVYKELCDLKFESKNFSNFYVVDGFGMKGFFSELNSKIKGYDLVYTIFGPNYLRSRARREVVGFAQLWILEFNNPISQKMSLLKRSLFRLKFFIQWLFFRRSDHFIVELEHVKNRLIDIKSVREDEVSVVYNTVSSLYFNRSLWRSVHVDRAPGKIALGLVARDYPHKNISILPLVAETLNNKFSLDVQFYVTLNDMEWSSKDTYFKKYVSTVGSLSPDQCPCFYEKMDGVIFPSLLECFSATPLEAMVMSKPLFASDKDFVRDVCKDFVIYIDPLDADDIAFNIANYFKSNDDRSEDLQKAREHAMSFSSAKGRAEQYLKIIEKNLEGL